MYRNFVAQHVYKFLRNLETRMYRTCGAQHGYEPIGSEPRECIVLLTLNMVTSSSNLESCFQNLWFRKHVEDTKCLIHEMYRTCGAQQGYEFYQDS